MGAWLARADFVEGTSRWAPLAGANRPNLKEVAARHLRDLILSGKLKAGQKIDQDALVDQLKMSKIPIREALITLETEGLVDNLARRGAFVAALAPDDVRDHYTIYGLVAGVAAGRAAKALTEGQIAELQSLVDWMARSGNTVEQEELNFRFHRMINRAGSSRRLTSALRTLVNSVPARFFEFTPDWAECATRDHQDIVDALRSRRSQKASKAMAAHLQRAGECATRMLQENGFWDEVKGGG